MNGPDFADVRGLSRARLAIEVAVAGQLPLLLRGYTGCGKTMLVRRISSILPALDEQTIREREALAPHVRNLDPAAPPVRMPHHTVSAAGVLGGGNPPRPGEVSLAHGGVLVLDEVPEFSRLQLESLPRVVRDGHVDIVRATATHRWPARFTLVCLSTPCPCGYLGHPNRVCTDSPGAVERYSARLAPLMPLFDLEVDVGLDDDLEFGESSAAVAERVARARLELRGPAPGDTAQERIQNTLAALGHEPHALGEAA